MYQSAIQVRTAFDKRRTSLEIGVGYEDDLDQAETAILEACRSAEGVLDDPDPQAYLIGLGDNAVLFDLRYWTDPHQADVRRIEHNVFKAVKNRLDAEGIDMPFPSAPWRPHPPWSTPSGAAPTRSSSPASSATSSRA